MSLVANSSTMMNKVQYTKRQKDELTRAQLFNERSTFLADWKDLGNYILPRRPRFDITDVNRGGRRNQSVIDSTATLAARTLKSGMMSGITSPARPWFRLEMPDDDMNSFGPVKEWLSQVTSIMQMTFLKSNLYNVLPIGYGDVGVFGTSAFIVEEDMQNVIRFTPFALGSYMISNNNLMKVDTFMREYRLTVRQVLKKFGIRGPDGRITDFSNMSVYIQNAYARHQLETWVDIVHIIEPNEDFDPNRLESKFKKYRSAYYERGTSASGAANQMDGINQNVYLSEKGYDYFPVLAPRWETNGEDAYGTSCPGIDAIGDIKQLQLGEKRGMQAIEKMINPPMIGPTLLRNVKTTILPGDITYADEREGTKGFRAAHEVQFRLDFLEQKQDKCRDRIRRCFYEDLFLMLQNDERSGVTAREINERHEEKMLAIGPVLEQLNQDQNDPLIDITFQMLLRQNKLPQPPQEIHGQPLKIEYISIMAQAQKLLGIEGIERLIQFGTSVGQLHPDALDKINFDQAIDTYGDQVSVPPKIIRPDDEVKTIRDQRQQQQAVQQKMQMAQQAAATAKDAAGADMSGDNALTRLMDQGKAGAIAPER